MAFVKAHSVLKPPYVQYTATLPTREEEAPSHGCNEETIMPALIWFNWQNVNLSTCLLKTQAASKTSFEAEKFEEILAQVSDG